MKVDEKAFVKGLDIRKITKVVLREVDKMKAGDSKLSVREIEKVDPKDTMISIESLFDCGAALRVADKSGDADFIREVIRKRVRYLIGEDSVSDFWFKENDPRLHPGCSCVACQMMGGQMDNGCWTDPSNKPN